MQGCWEPNLKLREAERLFEDQIIGPESIANIGGVASLFEFCFWFLIVVKWTDDCYLCLQMFYSLEQLTGRL